MSTAFEEAVREIEAYRPREEAIRMALEGRFDEYAEWLRTEPRGASELKTRQDWSPTHAPFLAMAMDRQFVEEAPRKFARACEDGGVVGVVDRFMQSPMEMAVRSASPASFDSMLAKVGGPKARYATHNSPATPIWPSIRLQRLPREGRLANLFDAAEASRDLLILALLLGKPRQAMSLVRAGFGPPSVDCAWRMHLRACLLSSAPRESFKRVAQIAAPKFDAAMRWTRDFATRSAELAEAMSTEPLGPGERARALALLSEGAAVEGEDLVRATDARWPDVLEAMFAAGADPNAHDRHDVLVLGRVDEKMLDSRTLQIWLDAGADPIDGEDYSRRYAPLSLWLLRGSEAWIQQAGQKSQGEAPFVVTDYRGTFATLFAHALSQGFEDLAFWMMSEKGCRFSHLDQDETPCRRSADDDMVARLKERMNNYAFAKSLKKKIKVPKRKKGNAMRDGPL